MPTNIAAELLDHVGAPTQPAGPHHEPLTDLLTKLNTSEAGLSDAEAKRRLEEFGANDVGLVHRTSLLAQFLRFCLNPLVLILLAASTISGFLGELLNAAIIGAMVILSVVVNF